MENINYSSFNIKEALAKGQKAYESQYRDNEPPKPNHFRVANTGCLLPSGATIGDCPRVCHLRSLGIDKPSESHHRLMWAAGYANEDIWAKLLEGSTNFDTQRKVQLQTGEWELTGHPDVVLLDPKGHAHTILELKSIQGMRQAIQTGLQLLPDLKHTIQTAAYMWLMKLPGILCYTNRSFWNLQFERKRYQEVCPSGKIEPFYRFFYLAFKGDTLFYRLPGATSEYETPITISGIKAYFDLVSSMGFQHPLPKRPYNMNIASEIIDKWTDCDYCPFKEDCDIFEHDYTAWIEATQKTKLSTG